MIKRMPRLLRMRNTIPDVMSLLYQLTRPRDGISCRNLFLQAFNRFYLALTTYSRFHVSTTYVCDEPNFRPIQLLLPQSIRTQWHKDLLRNQQIRTFSTHNGSNREKSKRQERFELSGKRIVNDPFVILGIIRSPTLQYTSVKTSFLKIAMKYHPDTATAQQSTELERETNKDLFVAARKAFESIMANPDGIAILKTEADDYVEEEDDFEEWFKNETGYDIPFMDAATMKEVADMTETVGGGLDRDGGMWTLARMVANTVKSGGDGKSVLQLDAGIVRDRTINGVLRRVRKR
jgi:hypothetical protein